MSKLEKYAEEELRRAGLLDEDSDYGGAIGEAVMELVRVFDAQDHSGFSAMLCLGLFEKLARFEPITPLTGEDDEWVQVADGPWQNKRCPRVFKHADGTCWDIQGKVFCEPSGACYTTSESQVMVEFPYTPKTEYIRTKTT